MTAETDAESDNMAADLANDVALAIVRALTGEFIEEPLDEEEMRGATLAAHAAIAAHAQWLENNGFRTVPAGAVAIPQSDEEAAAMMTAVKAYGERKKRKVQLLSTPKLILPPTMQ
jgi:DNA-binding transcriptional LysR family regulator